MDGRAQRNVADRAGDAFLQPTLLALTLHVGMVELPVAGPSGVLLLPLGEGGRRKAAACGTLSGRQAEHRHLVGQVDRLIVQA